MNSPITNEKRRYGRSQLNSVLLCILFLLLFLGIWFTAYGHKPLELASEVNDGEWLELGGSASGGGVSNNGDNSRYPSLAISPDGTPIIAWEDDDGDAEIYMRRWKPASSSIYFPAQEKAPGLGWRAGNQAQNSGTVQTDMTFTGYEPDGKAVECEGQSASPGSSVTFLTDFSCPQDHELFVSSVIRSDQPALAISNISNRGVGLAGGQYRGTIEVDAANTLFFPLVKNDHNGRTTGFFIQNVSDGLADIVAAFRVQGQYQEKEYKDIPPYTSIFVLPNDAAVQPGFGQVGSLTVTSPRPIAGTSLEFEEEVSIADNLQVASGFTPADSNDTVYCPLYRHVHAKKRQTTGVQVQNVSEASQRVDFTYVPIGGGQPVDASEQVESGASATFYAPELGIPEGTVGSVTITGEAGLVAVVNDQGYDQGQRNMATYTCFPAHQVSNQVYVPLYKELYGGNTTGIQIQNVSGDGSSTKVTLTYRVRNSNTAVSFTHETPIADGASITFWNVSDLASPADIILLTGDPVALAQTVGSVEITADQPIVAIVNENSYGSNASGQDAKNYEGFNSIIRGEGQIDFEDLVMSHLAQDHIDTWVLPIPKATKLTVMVAPASLANIVLSILDQNGNFLVDHQDYAPVGEVETISELHIAEPGMYRIEVSSDTHVATDYALMALEEESFDFRFRGTLDSGVPQNDAVDPDSDHFWFFSAQQGDTIDMQVTPDLNGDAYVELYGTEGQRLQTIDDNGTGEVEVLENYAIQSTGMYGIRVGEFDFDTMTYTIGLQKH